MGLPLIRSLGIQTKLQNLEVTKPDVYVQNTEPVNPDDKTFWVDTSTNPAVLKVRSQGGWLAIGS